MPVGLFDSLLSSVSDSPWTYLVVFALAFGDVLFPFLPSETALITAGVLAATGDLRLLIIIPCAAAGACLGDNTAYLVGHKLEAPVRARLFKGERRRHLERAEAALRDRGGWLIVIGRFIPGGRSAVTFAAGMLAFPWRRFIAFDVGAAVVWAVYGALVGYLGGKTFEEKPLYGILLALGIAFGIALLVEAARWWRRRQITAAAEQTGADAGD